MNRISTILITGASSGLGAALALAYAAPGVTLGLLGRDTARLESVAAAARAKGAEVKSGICDIRDAKAVAEWIHGFDGINPIDLLIANAGVSAGLGEFGETEEQVRKIFGTNVDGVINTVLPVLPLMQKRGGGQVAIISSLAGIRGIPSCPAYSGSKVAVRAWGEALRGNLKSHGIKVCVVCPGYIRTPMTDVNTFPMPFIMSAEKAAGIIVRGLRKNKTRIAFPLALYIPLWLISCLPAFITDPPVCGAAQKNHQGKHMSEQTIIESAWETRDKITSATKGEVRDAVETVMAGLDDGTIRVAHAPLRPNNERGGEWAVNQWVKKAVLLSFRLNDMQLMAHGPYNKGDWEDPEKYAYWYDKVPSKFLGWTEGRFKQAGFRAVPGCYVRRGAYIGPNVVLMPSFVNLGAYVGEGTMVDTWATIGSCAQIGKHCHISGGVGIGGVLEPLQAGPVIIEDNCFIGARSEVAEGVVVETGSVLSMGVYLGASTKIVDRETGEVFYGRVPAYSVVVPGTLPGRTPQSPSLYCAVIVKRVDEKTHSKTGINELLRGI